MSADVLQMGADDWKWKLGSWERRQCHTGASEIAKQTQSPSCSGRARSLIDMPIWPRTEMHGLRSLYALNSIGLGAFRWRWRIVNVLPSGNVNSDTALNCTYSMSSIGIWINSIIGHTDIV